MIEHQLSGSVGVALAHFSAVGLAAIIGSYEGATARFWWTEDTLPQLMIKAEYDEDAIADIVRAHAARAATPDSWLNIREASGARKDTGMFTARAKPPDSEAEWIAYGTNRRTARKSAQIDQLDGRMIMGTGEPAWWRVDGGADKPDHGASRWEMKTRNKGQEFLVHRLSPLATALAQRTTVGVANGLFGRSVDDETGKNSSDSRTATGLTTPGPVDSALAWCALWGLSAVPVIARKAHISRTPGMWPSGYLHPTRAALPVFTMPATVSRFSHLMLSKAFDTVGSVSSSQGVEVSGAAMDYETAAAWLKEQGVRAIVRFRILKTGSASAPERQVLDGEVTALR